MKIPARPPLKAVLPLAALAAAVALGVSHAKEERRPLPLGLEPIAAPEDNPPTPAKDELGRLLYFDKRLSRDNTVSCASCHNPAQGWTDQKPVSDGIRGQKGGRNSPTVLNAAYHELQFWDGRAPSLEEQAKGPIANPVEMGFTHEEVVDRISKIKGYRRLFKQAFGDEKVTIDRIAQALATFERLNALTGGSPFDRHEAGDPKALTDEQLEGMRLFFGKANCSVCHAGKSFADGDFHNLGVGMTAAKPDLGRYEVTKQERDRGAFRTPTLRNLTDTFPYMHDGSLGTLEAVIDFYDRGGEKNDWLSSDMKPLGLTPAEKARLVAFLKALDGEKASVAEPKAFPK